MPGAMQVLAVGCLALICAIWASAPGVPAEITPPDPEVVHLESFCLWDGPAPGAKGDADEDRPRIHPLRADPGRACGTAVIVCPGGGYNVRAMDYEGLQVAQWLNRLGVDAFLLSYRVRKYGYEPEQALTDARRAVRWVRHNAARYGIAPRRIGMIGFSAGGHVIARLAAASDPGDPNAGDPVERQPSRPDFVMLIYAPLGGYRPIPGIIELTPAAEDPPPAFIFHTSGDETIPPDGALRYYSLIRQAGAEAELHIFGGYGPHGAGLASGVPGLQSWPELAASWMRRNGWLTGKERVSVEGQVTVDGRPVGTAWVTFIPVESEHDPIAAARTALKDGTFSLDAAHGPAVGRHRVEVRQICKQFLTVPSMERERLYTRARPDDPEPIVVDLKPGKNIVNINILTK